MQPHFFKNYSEAFGSSFHRPSSLFELEFWQENGVWRKRALGLKRSVPSFSCSLYTRALIA